ncbi:MAG: hypothetical protein GY838_13600 [bacterium]|nr:hypothetical protein [bacterium]
MKQIVAVAVLLLLASGAQASRESILTEGAAPPDTLDSSLWINSADGCVYHYHSWLNRWLDHGHWIDQIVGARGFWVGAPSILTDYVWMAKNAGAASPCTLDVFAKPRGSPRDTVFTVVLGPYRADSSAMSIELPANSRITSRVRAQDEGAPDTPRLKLRVRKFVEP